MKMRRSLSAVLLAGLCAGVCLRGPHSVTAQQPAPQQPRPKQNQPPAKPAGEGQEPEQKPETSTIINVQLPVAVLDKGGRFITDLKERDFEILEDKTAVKIESFRSESDLPLDIALLMDTSNSVKPKLKFEKDAAISFLQTVLQPRKDRALFLTFDSEIELQQDFTSRIDLLSKAIDKAKARGETRLYDAVHRICVEKMFMPNDRRRALVLLTDGEDTISERSLKEAIDIAQRSGTTIFVISTKAGGFFGVQGGTVDSAEDKNLKRLAEETGGRAFFTGTIIDMEKGFASVARELRSQYILAYSPPNDKFDGKFRQIEVRLPGHKDLRIRTRKGYTALSRTASIAQ